MTKRGIITLFISVAIVAGVGGWLSAEALAAKIKRDRLADGLGEIQMAVERYAVDHEGVYPASLDEVLAAGTLSEMPENPYTKQPMPVLAPADAPVPGGVVYVAYGGWEIPGGGSSGQPEYVLVVYADKPVDKYEANPKFELLNSEDSLQQIEWSWAAGAASSPTPEPHIYYIQELPAK